MKQAIFSSTPQINSMLIENSLADSLKVILSLDELDILTGENRAGILGWSFKILDDKWDMSDLDLVLIKP